MIEDEAKTKACPQANSFCASKHFERADFAPPVCIASACMAWRVLPHGDTAEKIGAIKAHRAAHGSDLLTAKTAVEAAWRPTNGHGFCGLAGAPQ